MIEYDLKKNNNKKNEKAYGKYYAKPHISETVDLDELADHMHGHNSPFSAGTIKGILIDAVTHIKELLLMGKNVKLDNLAIFYISIKNIEGVRMKARATGDFRSVNLNLDANLKKYGAKKKKSSTTTDTETTTPSGDTGKSESGSTTNPGSGSEGDGLE